MNRIAIKQYLKNVRAEAGSTQVDPAQLAKGIEVEKEHTSTYNALRKNPSMPNSAAQALTTIDHLQEFPGKPYYTELEKLEEKLRGKKSSVFFHNKLILTAIARESDFKKEIPQSVRQIVEKDPQKVHELSKQMRPFFESVTPRQSQPQGNAYQRFIQEQMAKQQQAREPIKETLRKNLLSMQNEVNASNLDNITRLENANARLEANPQDWTALTDFIGQQLISALQKHTLYDPKSLLQALVHNNGSLKALLATDDYLK
jgi:hypothetical protein